ncbi:MAG: type II toxin-antitoxin system HicA family toxin [Cyanobacteria bacterium]|nr:type II toxin-antitoxin system HicA family toxin [Cyanobacteriota bacterium]
MKTEVIVFSDLIQLLSRLGFTQHSVGNQEVFQHLESGTSIVLPHYELRDRLRPIHIVGTRKILVENGLMEQAAFDGYLEKTLI